MALLTYYLFESTRWIIVKLTGVILLLVLSIFFAYLVAPLVEFLHRPIHIGGRKFIIPRSLAIVLSYLIIVAVFVLGIYLLAPRLGSQFPEFAAQARVYWASVGDKTARVGRILPFASNAGTSTRHNQRRNSRSG